MINVTTVHWGYSVTGSMVSIGPTAEVLGGHKLNMNKKKYYKEQP